MRAWVAAQRERAQRSDPRKRSERRSGERESVQGSPRGEAPRIRLDEMLDQQHLIARLAVHHLVDQLPYEQHAESSGTQPLGGAAFEMRDRIAQRVANRRMRECRGVESATRIPEVVDD